MTKATPWCDVPGGWTVYVENGLVTFEMMVEDGPVGSVHVEQTRNDDWRWTVAFASGDADWGLASNAQDAAIEAWDVIEDAQALAEVTEADVKGW